MTHDAAGQPPADSPRPEAPAPPSDRALALSHAPILVVIAALGLLDFASARFYGVFLSGTLSLPLAVFLIGFARHRCGRGDGRLIMAVADIALLSFIGVYLFQAFRTGATGIPAPGVLLLAVLTLAGPASVVAARRQPASTPISRSRGHAFGALALGGLTLASILVARTSAGSLPVDVLLLSAVPSLISLGLRLLAWWWGAGWILAITGIGSIAWAVTLSTQFGLLEGAESAVLGVLSLVLAAWRPRVPDQRPPSGRAAGIPAATTAWALTGALLLVPSFLLGPLAPRLIDCFDCPDPSPLAGPSILLDLVLVVGLPLIAVGLAVAARPGRIGWSAWLARFGFVASALVVGQALMAILGVPGFEFFLPVGPAAAIATIGFGFAIVRPAFLAGVGSWSAAACALVGMAWMSGTAAARLGPFDAPVVQAVALVAGVLVVVGLGRESATRPDVPAAHEDRVPAR